MIFSLLSLIIATVFTVLFIVFFLKGKAYSYMLEPLDDNEFKLRDLYVIGFVWYDILSKTSFLVKKVQSIKPNCSILYGEKYSEFYTRIYVAQGFTYAHLSICLVSALSGIVSGTTSVLLVLVGFVVGFVLLSNSLKAPKENVQKRADACVLEFPNMVSKLALMINSGMILREAWFLVAESTTGELHELMEYSCDLMNNGKSDIDAVYEFGIKSGSKEMKKFSSIITQGLEKGNSELSNMLMQQSSELWELKRQKLLQKGDVAATKLVVPTTLMFAGIILVVVSTALSGMSI